jgi:uncharacterized membrane protein
MADTDVLVRTALDLDLHTLHHRDLWYWPSRGMLPIALVGLWFVYRIIRGWVALGAGRLM